MNKLLAIGAVIVIAVFGVLLLTEQPTPLVDANRQLLATTPEEAWCAGQVFMNTRGVGSQEDMAECQEIEERSTEKDLDNVQKNFCDGVFDTASFPKEQCMQIVNQRRYWPTLKGTITNSWSRTFPYPGANAIEAGMQDDSRTGDRNDSERNDIGR